VSIINRNLKNNILNGLSNSPCIYLAGARQVGKSTLSHNIATELGYDYQTFDDVTTYEAAMSDPNSFINNFKAPVVLDEVQLVPSIFRVIKKAVDEQRLLNKAQSNGKFLLTGSTNIFALPKLADALVGRTLIYNLLPISLSEYHNTKSNFIDRLFNADFTNVTNDTANFTDYIYKTTLPEIIDSNESDIKEYYSSYLNTIIQRDIKQSIDIDNLARIPKILQLIASRVGSIYTDSSLATQAGLNAVTYKKYQTILESLFLTTTIPAWSKNIGKRLIKSGKTYISDTAMLLSLLNLSHNNLSSIFKGLVYENFIACELLKLLSLDNTKELYHLRTSDNKEIDFIIENNQGQIVAIEAKASSTITAEAFSNIKMLQDKYDSFTCGVVLYQGNKTLSFGKNLYAIPYTQMV